MKTEELYREDVSKRFYDDRYHTGYMDEWPPEKKLRILEVIKSLNLPERGTALDFGCGNGVFTDVLVEALPGWEVVGTDISAVALQHARERVPGASFVEATDIGKRQFDFLFTHHVFEHVYNLETVWRQVIDLMKPTSSMLHILPCGNEGSLEHHICSLRTDGINLEMENRFFYEDTGHVRRMNTDQFNSMAERFGFKLANEYYSNQYDGAVDWISQTEPSFVLMLTDESKAKDERARKELAKIRKKLIVPSVLRDLQRRVRTVGSRRKNLKTFVGFIVGVAAYPVASIFDGSMKRKAKSEWEHRKNDRGGSEMYLFFQR